MPDYVFAYHGAKKPESPEEGAKHMAKWKAWLGGLGDAVDRCPAASEDQQTNYNEDLVEAFEQLKRFISYRYSAGNMQLTIILLPVLVQLNKCID